MFLKACLGNLVVSKLRFFGTTKKKWSTINFAVDTTRIANSLVEAESEI